MPWARSALTVVGPRATVEHRQDSLAFGVAEGRGQFVFGDKALTILAQCIAEVGALRHLLRPLGSGRASGSVIDSCGCW